MFRNLIRKGINGVKKYLPFFYRGIIILLYKYHYKSKNTQLIGDTEKKPLYLFWTHDANLKYHLITQCILAKTLQEAGYQVLMIHCAANLQRCTVMDGQDIKIDITEKQRKKVCLECQYTGITHFKAYQLPFVRLDELDIDIKSLESNIYDYKGPMQDYMYDGINFGKLGIGEVIRVCKLKESKLPESFTDYIKKHVQASIVHYLAFEILRSKHYIARVTYFGDYGNVLGVAASCIKNQIPVTNLSHALVTNVQRHRITFMGALSTADQFWRLTHWERWQNYPLTSKLVKDIGEDILFRFKGTGFTIYSPNKTDKSENLFDTLKLTKKRKLVVAYTSSLDEALSTQIQYEGLGVKNLPEERPFVDQVTWLHEVAEHIEQSDDMQLVIRVHPREIMDGYSEKVSAHLIALRSSFKKDYKWTRVVWPEDPISSYDLGELADLVLIGWTSVGLELGRLGVPIIAAFPYCPYPYGSFIHYTLSKAKYWELMNNLLVSSPSIETLIKAFRWFHIARLSHAVDIGDMAPNHDFRVLPIYKKPKNTQKIIRTLIHGESVSQVNMESMSHNHDEEEFCALLKFIRKAILSLLGIEYTEDYKLILTRNEVNNTENKHHAYVQIEEQYVCFQYQSHCLKRYSPMLRRLIEINLASNINSIKEMQCNTAKNALCQQHVLDLS